MVINFVRKNHNFIQLHWIPSHCNPITHMPKRMCEMRQKGEKKAEKEKKSCLQWSFQALAQGKHATPCICFSVSQIPNHNQLYFPLMIMYLSLDYRKIKKTHKIQLYSGSLKRFLKSLKQLFNKRFFELTVCLNNLWVGNALFKLTNQELTVFSASSSLNDCCYCKTLLLVFSNSQTRCIILVRDPPGPLDDGLRSLHDSAE